MWRSKRGERGGGGKKDSFDGGRGGGGVMLSWHGTGEK